MAEQNVVFTRRGWLNFWSSEFPRAFEGYHPYPESYRRYVPESMQKEYFGNVVKTEDDDTEERS